jgi:hypothetical protein
VVKRGRKQNECYAYQIKRRIINLKVVVNLAKIQTQQTWREKTTLVLSLPRDSYQVSVGTSILTRQVANSACSGYDSYMSWIL